MLSDWELVVRLLIAAGLGSLIGAERERLVWAAGLRTHMLVSVGACLFMIVSAFGFATTLGTQVERYAELHVGNVSTPPVITATPTEMVTVRSSDPWATRTGEPEM